MTVGAKELLCDLYRAFEMAEMSSRTALRRAYQLGLLAAIEECERTAETLPESMRTELTRLAVRIRQRVSDTKDDPPHVRTYPP